MLESTALQQLIFPIGVLYFFLHAGPLMRLWYEPSIRGGTRWRFFASEVALFLLWLLGSPVLWHSTLGRGVIAMHLSMHVVFTILDAVNHNFLLDSALTKRRQHPWMWMAKEMGLVIDTASHGVVVLLVAQTMPLSFVAFAIGIAGLLFAWVTRGYLRKYSELPRNA